MTKVIHFINGTLGLIIGIIMFIVFTIGYVLLVCLGCIDDSKVGDLCDSLQKFLEQEKKAKEEEVQEQVEDTPEKN